MTLEERAQSHDPEQLLSVAKDPRLTEDLALSLLTRRDLPGNVIEAIARNASVLKHRKVTLAIVSHPHAPRHVSLPITRSLYTFELVKIALLPAVPADVKVGVDETIISRLGQVSEGERLTLAKQASGRVAGALLLDKEERVNAAALNNSQMTEALILKALSHPEVPAQLVLLLCSHPQWSLRRDVRLALLRNRHTPLASAIAFLEGFPEPLALEVLSKSELRPEIRNYLLASLGKREAPDS